jgi:LPS export ABC transporter protein LptC
MPSTSCSAISAVKRALLCAALVAVACAGCAQRKTTSPAAMTGELPDQQVTDFVLTETETGRADWKLYARDASTYSARNLVIAHQVRIDFFDEKGAQSSELVARQGEINQRTRNMTARGNVVLQTTGGTRLSSEELQFLNKEQKVLVPEDQLVRVERGSDVLTGYGFESDPELKSWQFKHQVKATVRTKSGGLVGERESR